MQTIVLLLSLALFAVACGDDESSGKHADAGDAADGGSGMHTDSDASAALDGSAGAGKLIGPKGGTIKSSDGKITLTIPANALKSDEMISMEPLAKGKSKALLKNAIELVSYRMEPDGLVFEKPIEVGFKLSHFIQPNDEKPAVPMVLVSTFGKGQLELASDHNLSVDLDSGDATITFPVKHFSDMSAETWKPENKLKTSYFYFEIAPKLPAELEMNKKYGVGLSFYIQHFLNDDLPMTYTDMSRGVTFSGGKDPVKVGSLPGEEKKATAIVLSPGTYECGKLGSATYRAQLLTDEFIAPAIAADECESATDKVKCVDDVLPPGPRSYRVELHRTVTCIPEKAVEPEGEGAPFSGFVTYTRHNASSKLLMGAFYDGGADQAKFDKIVLDQRRKLGIMSDRGANGTCRRVDPERYELNVLTFGGVELSHVGTGADDQLGLDFLSPPTKPTFKAPYSNIVGMYESAEIFYNVAFTDMGIGVHVPASASEPTIVLPGWDEDITGFPKLTPGSSLAALVDTDIVVSWDAEKTGGELIHIWGVGNDADSEASAFECFAKVEDQLLTIPAASIKALFPNMTDPLWIEIYVVSGSHTTSTYKGKTLDGFNLFSYSFEEMTVDPENPGG